MPGEERQRPDAAGSLVSPQQRLDDEEDAADVDDERGHHQHAGEVEGHGGSLLVASERAVGGQLDDERRARAGRAVQAELAAVGADDVPA